MPGDGRATNRLDHMRLRVIGLLDERGNQLVVAAALEVAKDVPNQDREQRNHQHDAEDEQPCAYSRCGKLEKIREKRGQRGQSRDAPSTNEP